MNSKSTKASIIQQASLIIHKKGFNNTGINEILKAAGVPKGSFYHYFRNKEDFGLSLLDYYSDYFINKTVDLLNDKSKPPIQRLKSFFDDFLHFFESIGCELGCPIGNISQEMGDLNPVFRQRLEEIFHKMKASIEEILIEAGQMGHVPDSMNASDTADFIINSWEGALLRMKVKKSTQPLYLFDRMIFNKILKH